MKRIATIVLVVLLFFIVFSDSSAQNISGKSKYSDQLAPGISLSEKDSVLALSVPILVLPESYKEKAARDLPYSLNNAELPYFRPIFSQESFANCGQSAGIGYNFTYEINRARELSAGIEANQYTPQFTWNFMNGGEGWYGVSYFHSFDVLKRIGNPSVEDYGGMFEGGDQRWMSGYGVYQNSMLNRIEEVYSIKVNTIEGINTLKYWLCDHLESAESGGVACFYAGSPWNLSILPDDSPEGGKYVMSQWQSPATHAMTIVGYNDSIRYDYNGDGKYTNHIDINEDGNVDVKDWEIGGFLFANSYGTQWANSGFCYLMYNSLAQEYGDGGIWNQSVNVLKVNPDYSPLAGIRLKLKHDSRNKLKITAGISSDTVLNYPTKTIDFPIINFQGGGHVLRGIDSISNGDEIELEIDITSLLGEVKPGDYAKFFLQIIEKDPEDVGLGQILHFGIIDYGSDNFETVFLNTPIPIENNKITTLSLLKELQFDKVNIISEELPVFEPSIPYTFQFEAEGGYPDYKWSLLKDYVVKPVEPDYPLADAEELEFSDADNDFVNVELPFSFPFYGDTINQINIHIDGFVTFENIPLPYPYFIGESTMLIENRMIAPFATDLRLDLSNGEKVSVESTNEFIYIKWEASYGPFYGNSNFVFAVKLFPSGEIKTYYEKMDIPEGVIWNAGISNGDQVNYILNNISDLATSISNQAFVYSLSSYNSHSYTLDSNGEFEAFILEDNHINQFSILVTDRQNILARKQFQLTSGLLISFECSSRNDDKLDYGEIASINAVVKNISPSQINNIVLDYSIEDEFISVLSEKLTVGTLLPGETKEIDSTLVFNIASDVMNQHIISLNTSMISDEKNWDLESSFIVNAPIMNIINMSCNGKAWIEPGLTNLINIQVINTGHSVAEMMEVKFVCESEFIQVIGDDVVSVESLSPNENYSLNYKLKADPLVSSGTIVPCEIQYYQAGTLFSSNSFGLQIGKNSVLLIDLDPKHTSITEFENILESLELNFIVSSGIPNKLSDHKAVFILLGSLFSNYELSYSEGLKLNEYLNDDGNLYMEGRATWMQPPTPVHGMFNVEALGNGSYFPIDTVYTKQSDTISQEMLEFNHENPYSNHYFLPIGGAFSVLNITKNDSACVVANQADNYKTIASIIEFGSLTNIDTTFTVKEYLFMLTDFFDLYETSVGISEFAQLQKQNIMLKVYPNPFTDFINIQIQSSESENIVLQIFNRDGKIVYANNLKTKQYNNMVQQFTWDGNDFNGSKVKPGIYFIKVFTDFGSSVTKIIIL